jgi:hypothetical protein
VIVTFADPETAELTALVAVTVTMLGKGTALGAVYTPPGVIVPTVLFPPGTLFTLQFTAELDRFVTVAKKACDVLVVTLTVAGETVTLGCDAAMTVTCAVAKALGLAWLVAVTATVAGIGTTAGAVYSPVLLIEPTSAFPPTTPPTLHVTV